MTSEFLCLKVDPQKMMLSSETSFYKTENFLKKTQYISNIDYFLSKLAEGVMSHMGEILENENTNSQDYMKVFSLETEGEEFCFLIKFGYQLGGLNAKDIVFFDFVNSSEIRRNDQRLNDYLKTHSMIVFNIHKTKFLSKRQEFEKLYLVSPVSGVNLPKLTKEQMDIVETMDQNVLVQGVAGSGKTNICVDKIIYSSCRNYGGKVLYSTYSRGLLTDTKLKVEAFKNDLVEFEEYRKKGDVVFLDDDHKKALENKFGIFFFSSDDEKIFDKIGRIIEFLNHQVDYLLIEDIYRKKFAGEKSFADEKYFIKTFIQNTQNHQVKKALSKVEKYSYEVIYKEIYGMIFGNYDRESKREMLGENEYIAIRENSFSREECRTIYQIALEYRNFLRRQNIIDLNFASRELIEKNEGFSEYSLTILDEVQDFTQVNLCLFAEISLKLFCVGDALQMINPAYFSFSHLKNLLFLKEEASVKQLRSNFRNTRKIEEVINSMGEINRSLFGTHNFVVEGRSVDNGLKTTTVFVRDENFARQVAKSGFDNFTFVVSSVEKKQQLKEIVKNQEVLTVSEIKGLERGTVVAYDLLSDHYDKWQRIMDSKQNHKEADENSVYRYYYNLFYVGLTRARQNLFVVETKNIEIFERFLRENFDTKNTSGAIKLLGEIVSRVEFSQGEILSRVREFIKMGQFENAMWTVNKIQDDVVRLMELTRIDITEKYIQIGKHREAGVKFWEHNMTADAREQFVLSGDEALIRLLDACSGQESGALNVDIVSYFDDVKDNGDARRLILETVVKDRERLKEQLKEIRENFKKVGDKNGRK